MALTVGAFGKQDSFSYLAAKWAYGPEVRSLPYTQDVFDQIKSGQVDIGVVPLENVAGGWVSEVLHSLIRLPETDPDSKIIREIDLPITLCVATKGPQTRLHTATKIFSHPYPLLHASKWITDNSPQAERIAVTSTSHAAEMAAKDGDSLALCNSGAAKRHGLRVLLASLPSTVKNVTRFVSVSKRAKPQGRSSMTSMWFSVKDKPGSLLAALESFKNNKINLKRIESRPLDSFSSYAFFIELEGVAGASNVEKALKDLKKRTEKIAMLGSYPVDTVPKKELAGLY